MLHPDRTVLEEALDTPQRAHRAIRPHRPRLLPLPRRRRLQEGRACSAAARKAAWPWSSSSSTRPTSCSWTSPPPTSTCPASTPSLYALDQFEGTLIFISHDVYFIRALANHVVHVNAGRLTHYPGGYQYYLDKTKAESARAGLTARAMIHPGGRASSRALTLGARSVARPPHGRTRSVSKPNNARRVRASARPSRKSCTGWRKRSRQLEARQAEIVAELESPETYEKPGRAQAINRELADVQARLAELNPEWEQAATQLAALD